MIKEIFFSLSENIKKKSTNPFFGTLIIVWIIHNYKFLLEIYYFDNKLPNNDRINIYNNFFSFPSFYYNLAICIFISFITLAISYALLLCSRYMLNYYEDILLPNIYKLTDKGAIVLKSKYQSIVFEKEQLEKKYELLREEKSKLQIEFESLSKKYEDSKIKITKNDTDQSTNKIVQTKKISKERKNTEKNKIRIGEILNILYSKHSQNELSSIITSIRNKDGIDTNNKIIKTMVTLNIVKKGDVIPYTGNKEYYYSFTPNGDAIANEIIFNENK